MNQEKWDSLQKQRNITEDNLIALCVMMRDDRKTGMNTLYIEERIAKVVDGWEKIKDEQMLMAREYLGVKV